MKSHFTRSPKTILASPIEALESRIVPTTFTWTGGSGTWEDSNHWSISGGSGGFGYPAEVGDIAVFSSLSPTVALSGTFTISQLQFTGNASPIFNNGLQLSTLIFTGAGGAAGVISASNTSTPVLNVGVTDASATGLSLLVNDTATLTIGNLSSGPTHGRIVKNGPGTLVLDGNSPNSFVDSGAVTGLLLAGGITKLQKTSGNAISSNVVVTTGAALNLINADQIADTASVTISAGTTMALQANETIKQIFGSGVLILNDHQLTLKESCTFNGTFLSNGKLRLTDTTLILGGSQTSTGAVIDALGGTMNVDGNYSSVTFRAGFAVQGAQIGGTGTVGNLTTNGAGGFLSPGATPSGAGSTGILTVVGTVSNGAGSMALQFQTNGSAVPGTGFDQLVLSGSGQIGSSIVATFVGFANFPLPDGQSITIVDVQNGSSVAFSNLAAGATIAQTNGGSTDLKISYVGGDGNDVIITAVANGNNAPPVANADPVTLNEDSFISIDVLANDTDPNSGDTLSVTGFTPPSNGFVTQNGNSLTYTPFLDYFGSDTFTYTVSDGTATSTGTVNVTVNDVVDPVTFQPTSIAANGKTATFLQADGDTLVVKTNVGKFTAANFVFAGLPSTPGQGVLQKLDLSAATALANSTSFKNAVITTTVIKGASGDGFADIGYIDARGTDLKSISVRGDLGRIDAGDTNFKTPGLLSLTALSMGVQGNDSQANPSAPTVTNFASTIVGKLGLLKVTKGTLVNAPAGAGAFRDVCIRVVADATVGNFKFASIGKVIVDDLDGASRGFDEFSSPLGIVYSPGTIIAEGRINSVLVNNTILGGSGDYSGSIYSRTSLGLVIVGSKTGPGNITGGGGFDSGAIFAGNPDINNGPKAGTAGPFKIKGTLQGGAGDNSGTLYADGGLLAVTVGAVTGGGGSSSGGIISSKGMGAVTINGNLTGAGGYESGGILAFNGNVASINIKGALITGTYYNGIYVHGTLGALTLGSMQGTGLYSGYIEVLGKLDKTGAPLPGPAIGKVLVKGNASGWAIIAGLDENAGGSNSYASIGSVTVLGTAENMSVLAGTAYQANADPSDDAHIGGGTLPTAVASIASILVKNAATNCIFEAQWIKSAKLGGVTVPLTPGKLTDANLTPATGNLVREL